MKPDDGAAFHFDHTPVERPTRNQALSLLRLRQQLSRRPPGGESIAIPAAHLAALLDIVEAARDRLFASSPHERIDADARLVRAAASAFADETMPEAKPWRPALDVVRLREIANKAFGSCTIADLDAVQSALEPLLDAYEGMLQTQPGPLLQCGLRDDGGLPRSRPIALPADDGPPAARPVTTFSGFGDDPYPDDDRDPSPM